VVAAWANAHVECVFGVALLGLFAAAEWIRPRDLSRAEAVKASGIAVISAIATLLTPYGIGIWRYLYENTFVPQVIDIAEVHPPYLPNYRGFFVWVALCAVLALWRRRRLSLAEAAVLLLFGALGLRYLRLTPLLFVAGAPFVARALDEAIAGPRARRIAAATAVVLAMLLIRVPFPSLLRGVQIGDTALEPESLFSPRAMQFAREHDLSGPVFTSINLGGYVAWHLYPQARPSLDARLQAVPPAHFAAWAALTRGMDWAVLSVPRVNPWSGNGRFDPALWAPVYKDNAIEILVRRDGRYRQLITSF
jgi:hypothetical protein